MSRRGFNSSMRLLVREMARAERARKAQVARTVAAQQRAVRAAEMQARVDAKEAARLYFQSSIEEAQEMTDAVLERDANISNLLTNALKANPAYDPRSELEVFEPKLFDESGWLARQPKMEDFVPQPLPFVKRLIPGATKKHDDAIAIGNDRFKKASETHVTEREAARQEFVSSEEARKLELELHNEKSTRHIIASCLDHTKKS